MPNTSILGFVEGESESTPKKFKNIDTESFQFTWDGKPFGGALPERMKSYEEEVIDRDITGKDISRRMVTKYEFLKEIEPDEIVIMPKYLVNYAAMHLARKIYKRNIFAGKSEIEKNVGIVKVVDAEKEMKLQKEMVAPNFEEEPKTENLSPEPTPPEATTTTQPNNDGGKTEGKKPEEVSVKCDKCEFVAKSPFGLQTHKRSHK